jgi:ATP-dependent RNA helicase RhlE
MHFADLELIAPLLRAVADEGYSTPTPIQAQAIPHVLAGRDLLACAQTGTGKTAAFALPILQRLAATPAAPSAPGSRARRPIRVLVLTPTRELAAQIGESFDVYGKHLRFKTTVIFGGVGQGNQEKALAAGPDVLVATPGRLLDLASQRLVSFAGLEVFVLDEADRMLDMGFIHDVRRVIALLPRRRQTLFFSATMPPDIIDLSASILTDPAKVAVTPIASTAEKIDQQVYFVEKADKRALLEHVLGDRAIERVLVFTRTKHGANRVAEGLVRARISAAAIHGNKSQGARERALSSFKAGATRVLVATDIAARGLDIEAVTHVINFDLPDVPESYVHRIGRTARAGASGIAVSFCDREERPMLGAIERLIRMRIAVAGAPPIPTRSPAQQEEAPPASEPRRRADAPRGRFHDGPANGSRPRAPAELHRPAASAGMSHAPRSVGPRENDRATPGGDAPRPAAGRPASASGGSRRFVSRPRRRYASS